MRNIIVATIAAFLFGTAVLAQPAEARCVWNGFAMECWHHPHPDWWARHHYWGPGPYRYYGPY